MTKPLVFFIVGVLLTYLLITLLEKPEKPDPEIQRQKLKADSASVEAEKWRLKAAEYFQAYSTSKTEGLKMEQRFNYIREENEKLKRRPVLRYSNTQLDSALSARYPK